MFEFKYLNSQAQCETAVTAALLLVFVFVFVFVFVLNEAFAYVFLYKIETFLRKIKPTALYEVSSLNCKEITKYPKLCYHSQNINSFRPTEEQVKCFN